MLSESLSGKIDSIRKKNSRLEIRHREIELDKKYARENGSAIMPSQIKVTITGKQNRGPQCNAGFDGHFQRSQQFNNYPGRRPLKNGFSKSMSRLPQDSNQCSNFTQDQFQPPANMHNSTYRKPFPVANGRCPEKFQKQQDNSQFRNYAPPRFVEIEESSEHNQRNNNNYGQVQSNFPRQRNDLIIKNRSQTRFNQRGNTSRGGGQYGQQSTRGFPEGRLNNGREQISNAKSMSSLDKINPVREVTNGSHFEPRQYSCITPHNDNRNRSGRNTQPRFIYNPRNTRTSFCNHTYENCNSNDYICVSLRSEEVNGHPNNVSNSVNSEMSTQTNVWPLQPVPCKRNGLWVRGLVVREKEKISEKSCDSNKETNIVNNSADNKVSEPYIQPPSCCSKATSPHRPTTQDDGNHSDDFVNFDDEYIDDNPLDDLDQFTLKIDMDGGFVVHDASILDPILQRPISSWIEPDLEDLNIDDVITVDEGLSGKQIDTQQKKRLKRSSSLSALFVSSTSFCSGILNSSFGEISHVQNVSSYESVLRRVFSAACLVLRSNNNESEIDQKIDIPSIKTSPESVMHHQEGL